MLIKTQDNQQKIKAEESILESRHELEQADRAQQVRDAHTIAPDKAGMDITVTGARMGRPMSAWTMQQKLNKVFNFLYEPSIANPGSVGIYVPVPHPPIEGCHKIRDQHCLYIGAMGDGIMPEFSIIEKEIKMVPDASQESGYRPQATMDKEVRGWRTTLAQLLKAGWISAYDVEKHFQISLGRDSQRWQAEVGGTLELISQGEVRHGNGETADPGSERRSGKSDAPDDAGTASGVRDGDHRGSEEAERGGTGGEGGAQAPEGTLHQGEATGAA